MDGIDMMVRRRPEAWLEEAIIILLYFLDERFGWMDVILFHVLSVDYVSSVEHYVNSFNFLIK